MSHLACAVEIAVSRSEKTPLIGGQKHACIVPAAAWIAAVDCRTASQERMSLRRTAIVRSGPSLGSATVTPPPLTVQLLRLPSKLLPFELIVPTQSEDLVEISSDNGVQEY